MANPNYRLFLCHRASDDSLTESVRRGIVSNFPALDVYTDYTHIGATDALQDTLYKELSHSDVLLVIFTEAASRSLHIFEEMIIAREWQIPMIFIIQHGTTASLHPAIKGFQLIEANLSNMQEGDTKTLIDRIVQHLRNTFDERFRERVIAAREIRTVLRGIRKQVRYNLAPSESPESEVLRFASIREVLNAAKNEIRKIVDPDEPYRMNLSLEKNFLIRALPYFSRAESIVAVSVDGVSRFWRREDQTDNALAYLRKHAQRTHRLFVSDHPRIAHELRDVFAAHHRTYGSATQNVDTGGVYICSTSNYFECFISKMLGHTGDFLPSHILQDYKNKDFGILEFSDHGYKDFYELTLSGSRFEITKLDSTLSEHHKNINLIFSQFMDMRPGAFDDQFGVLRWEDAFAEDNDEWQGALQKVFGGGKGKRKTSYGDVFHFAFFTEAVDPDEFARAMSEEAHRLKSTRHDDDSRLAVEELVFGRTTPLLQGLQPLDGRFKGKLRMDNWFVQQFPLFIMTRHRSTHDLITYYESVLHSHARENILKTIDKDGHCQIAENYKRARLAMENNDKAETVYYFQNVENSTASLIFFRADFQEFEDIRVVVKGNSIGGQWKEEWKRLKPR